jgi:hypothetical protein
MDVLPDKEQIDRHLKASDRLRKRVTGRHEAVCSSSSTVLCRSFPTSSSLAAHPSTPGQFILPPDGSTPDGTAQSAPSAPMDVLSLTPVERRDWIWGLCALIARQSLPAILDGVYWASSRSGLETEWRMELMPVLYRHALDVPSVRHLLVETVSPRCEPAVPLRELSLSYFVPLVQAGELTGPATARTVADSLDPQLEPIPHLRRRMWETVGKLMEPSALVRKQVFQLLWRQQETDLNCRQQHLRVVAHWTDHPAASEQERFEGLYWLQRSLDAEREISEVAARELWTLNLTLFPSQVRRYVQDEIRPRCQALLPRCFPGKTRGRVPSPREVKEEVYYGSWI